jgi:hypothetical protein
MLSTPAQMKASPAPSCDGAGGHVDRLHRGAAEAVDRVPATDSGRSGQEADQAGDVEALLALGEGAAEDQQFGERLVEGDTLVLQLADAAMHDFQQRLHLFSLRWIDIVKLEIFLDFAYRKTEALTAQDEDHPCAVALHIDPCIAGAARRDQTLRLVEMQGADGNAEFGPQLGHGVERIGMRQGRRLQRQSVRHITISLL